jgi:Tfp pilus assembly protein PilF
MSKTLNLAECLLNTARNLHHLGRFHEALPLLQRLAQFRELASSVAEEAHALLAEIQLSREEFAQARRHLAVALAYAPKNADYHYLLAIAWEEDPEGEPRKASRSFRQAVRLAPQCAVYWLDFGLHLCKEGRTKPGFAALRRACKLASDDVELVRHVTDAMHEHGNADEARSLLRQAIFRNGGQQKFRLLWQRHQFRMLHAEQRAESHPTTTPEGEPILLPIVATEQCERHFQVGEMILRMDEAEPLGEPRMPVPKRLPFPKRPR